MLSTAVLSGSQPSPTTAQRPGLARERTGSMSASTSLVSPPLVDPEPAYIAALAASQIVTNDHQHQAEAWFEETGDKVDQDPAVISSASLSLVNAFLDQLLFSFLASARSTSIASLRPAVSEVLKPRLAKDAINGADEELHEFLGGGDDEELSAFHNGLEPGRDWDLNLVWRRTRLRCMVYTRLGDMEEEDEESFVESEHLEGPHGGHGRLSRDLGIVSPAAAIFLTSILEFVGEQALMIAGEAAYIRTEAKQVRTAANGVASESRQPVTVEESDMEKIALNTTLGRLWRSWKKRVRSPSMLGARTISRDFTRAKVSPSFATNPAGRSASVSEGDETTSRASVLEAGAKAPLPGEPPLSSSDGNRADNRESRPAVEDGIQDSTQRLGLGERRPSSMVFHSPKDENKPFDSFERMMQRRRSSSLPTLQPVPYVSPLNDSLKLSEEALDFTNNNSQFIRKHEPRSPAGEVSNAPTLSTKTNTHDNGMLQSESEFKSKRTLKPVAGVVGMSKEEFDRQMLDLVQEMKPQSMPDLVDDKRQILHADAEGISPQAALPEQSQTIFTRGKMDNVQAPVEMPASQGVDLSTIQYWRGSKNSSKTKSTFPSNALAESEGSMQGAQPRAPSDGSEYGRVWERQGPFSYYGPSASSGNHGSGTASRPEEAVPLERFESKPSAKDVDSQEEDNGAPPLTPLRELMEAAHDTSDEASSLAPSQDASRLDHIPSDRFQTSDTSRPGSLSFRAKTQVKPASKLSDLRAQLPAVNTGTDRAAVQRVMPSPTSAREPLTPIGRTSTSSNRDLRPIQTSSSGTSQVSQKLKGLVGRDSSDARRPGTSRRSSEGSSSMTSDKRSLRTPKAEDAQRSFDQLIKSDETIQYTLTPQNMREMEGSESPRWNHKRTETAEMADFIRRTGPEEPETIRPVSSRSKVSLKGLNGLRSNPTSNARHPESTSVEQSVFRPIPTQTNTSSRPSTSHSQAGFARDARTKDESVREFADFLRSTGPAPGALSPLKQGPPIAEPRPIKALPATSSRPPSQQGLSKTVTKSNPGEAVQPLASRQAQATMPKRPPPKLQAREATVSSDSTSDLADFIRQGPVARSEGRMRLPRTGERTYSKSDAPENQRSGNGEATRPGADTNGLQRVADVNPNDAENSRVSVASTQASSVPAKSVLSVNSRTGLLEQSNAQPDSGLRTSGSVERRPPRQDDPPHPIRKQRRIKDPYAVDTDSEDENAYRSPPRRREESLIEFLNSVTPPPSPPVSKSPFTDSLQNTTSTETQKNRYPSMRERLTRNAVSNANAKTRTSSASQPPIGVPSVTRGKSEAQQPISSVANGKAPMPQPAPMNRGRSGAGVSDAPSRIKSQAPQLPPLNPRETSPHLISQVGTKYDTYKITSPTYAAHVDRERKGLRRQQPRGERDPGSDVGDLADFLKNSGPPTFIPAPPRPVSPIKEKEKEGGFGRMFNRRKRSVH